MPVLLKHSIAKFPNSGISRRQSQRPKNPQRQAAVKMPRGKICNTIAKCCNSIIIHQANFAHSRCGHNQGRSKLPNSDRWKKYFLKTGRT